jgi:hypothetical protein
MVASPVIKVERKYGVSVWRNVVIAIVHGDLDATEVRRLGESYAELSETYPNGIAGITLLRGSLSVGTKETNAEAQRVLGMLRGNMLHIAVVIENRGFVAQLLRSVIRTLNSVSRGKRLSIATDAEEAVRVIAPHVVSIGSSSVQQLQKELLQTIAALAGAIPTSG